jgi:glycosyltransferase involved in cell wall biosynthesis
MSELVSVIIPTWNRANTIIRAVKSVLGQTYSDLEILICDDGSQDNTRELIEGLNDLRIRMISFDHTGKPSSAKNKGIAQAKGDWIAFLDSDDEWHPEKLTAQIEAMKKHNLRASSTNAQRIVEGDFNFEEFIYWKRKKITFNNLLAGNLIISSSAVFHRSLLSDVVGFPEHLTIAEDYALWLRVATLTPFAYINGHLVKYYDQPSDSVRKKQIDIREAKRNVFDDFRRWAEQKPERLRFAGRIPYRYLLQIPVFIAMLTNVMKKLSR